MLYQTLWSYEQQALLEEGEGAVVGKDQGLKVLRSEGLVLLFRVRAHSECYYLPGSGADVFAHPLTGTEPGQVSNSFSLRSAAAVS